MADPHGRLAGDAAPEESGRAARAAAVEVLQARLCAQVGELLRRDPEVLGGRDEATHRMRVAARRVRAVLQTFAPLFDAGRTGPIVRELDWLAGNLGAARDAEVLRGRLEESVAALRADEVVGPLRASLSSVLDGRLELARSRLAKDLASSRHARLLEDLARLAALPPWAAPASTSGALRDLVEREHRVMSSRIRRALGLLPGRERDEAFHAARKAAKRARYGAEALARVEGGRATRYVKAVVGVQEALGERHDAAMTAAFLACEAARVSTSALAVNSYTYGLLAGLEHKKAEVAEQEALAAWKAARQRMRKWVR